MNWIRRWRQDTEAESALPRLVLPTAGHVLDEQVAAGDQAGDREPDGLVVALHDKGDVFHESARKLGRQGGVLEDRVAVGDASLRKSSPMSVRPMLVTSELEEGRRQDHPSTGPISCARARAVRLEFL